MASFIHHLQTQYQTIPEVFQQRGKPLSAVYKENNKPLYLNFALSGLLYNISFLPYKLTHGFKIFQPLTSVQEKLDKQQVSRGINNLLCGSLGAIAMILHDVIDAIVDICTNIHTRLINNRSPKDFMSLSTYLTLVKDIIIVALSLIPTSLKLVTNMTLRTLESANRLIFGTLQIVLFPLNYCSIPIRSLWYQVDAPNRSTLSHPVTQILIHHYEQTIDPVIQNNLMKAIQAMRSDAHRQYSDPQPALGGNTYNDILKLDSPLRSEASLSQAEQSIEASV